jgi:hypothetical protein
MTEANKRGSAVRKFVTGTVAAGALLALYAVGFVSVTGSMLTMSTTSADAAWRGRGWRGRGWRGRGWRGARGWYRGRGWHRGGVVCRHRGWTSSRVCWR